MSESTMLSRSLAALLLLLVCPACGSSDDPEQTNGESPSSAGDDADDDGADDADDLGDEDGEPADSDDVEPARKPDARRPGARPQAADAGARDASSLDSSIPMAGGEGGTTAAPDARQDASAPAAGACDRACLLGFIQNYLDALVARDPSKLKVAQTVKYTDNGVASKLGEGLWKTASGLVKEARLDFADPLQGQVATMAVVHENGSTPVIYLARLKVVAQEITEIETMSVRRQGAANGFFNPMRMVPEPVFLQPIDPAKRMSREALNDITELYLDYLEGKKRGSELPVDDGCKRYENGQVTASGKSSFNTQSWRFKVTRRTLIIDEEAGITWGMYPFSQAANALVVGEAFKIIDGKLMMIQAVMANMPTKAWD